MDSHDLESYNLYIVDDEYTEYHKARYASIAEEACRYWKAFIEICGKMEGEEIKGKFANSITEFIEELGEAPGQELYELLDAHRKEIGMYISELDDKDEKIY